jgi:hypothetical protein
MASQAVMGLGFAGCRKGAQMDLEHRSDIRIDLGGIILVLAVAFLTVMLTTATLWIALR